MVDYQRHYDRLIERAKSRVLDSYTERHHILPRSMGGGSHKENIVHLTPEEHFVAHQFLVKIYPGNYNLIWALVQMTGHSKLKRNNKFYGWLRRRASIARLGKKLSKEHCAKLSEAHKGHVHSKEHKEKIGDAHRGKKRPEGTGAKIWAAKKARGPCFHSEESKAKMRAARLGKSGTPWTDEQKAKSSAKLKGVPKSPEHRAALSAARKGRKFGPRKKKSSPSDCQPPAFDAVGKAAIL